jgi:hypothetical protein
MYPIALARVCMRSLIAGIRTYTHVDITYYATAGADKAIAIRYS